MTTDLIPDYPRHPGEATPQWVTWALRQGGLIDDAQVVSVTARALGAGVGFLSGIAQLSLAWDRSEPGAMSSVILKMDCDSEFFRNVGEGELHVFEREIHFYREMAPQAPIRLTHCYHTQMDPALGHYILLFEDLTALESLDEVKGIKLDLALIALATIARFHAAWWENPARTKFEWMPRLPSMICDGFHERWPIFKKEFANSFSAEVIAAGELVNQNIERIVQRLDRGPETIVHSDFRGDNLLFDKSSPDGIVVLDWQLAMRGNALYDVARLITDTVHPGDGSRPHQIAVRHWHEALCANGVRNYSYDEAWRDYRLNLMMLLFLPVEFGDILGELNARGKQLATMVRERFFASVLETDALSLLPSL